MSSDQPGGSDWTSPGQPAPPPPYVAPAGTGGWATGPPPGQYGWPPPPPKPGIIPLRPLGLGEILDGAFTTIRRYPAATLGLAAAVMLIVELIQVPVSYYLLHGVTTDVTGRTNTVQVITIVAELLSSFVLAGILTAIVGQAVLGRPMSIGAAWSAARPVLWRVLGASTLIFLIGIGIIAVGALPGIVVAVTASHDAGVGLAVLGGLPALVLATYVLVSLTFTTPILVLEQQGIRAAMSRSRTLIKGSWWRIFGILLLTLLIAQIIAGIIVLPFSASTILSVLNGHPTDQYRFTPLLLTGIGTLIASTLVRPFSAGVVALLYLDRRMRAEALDLTLQQAAAKGPS